MPEVLCEVEWCINYDAGTCVAKRILIRERGIDVYAICGTMTEKPGFFERR